MDSLKRTAVVVVKDVDSQPGGGASFGEGMSVLHRKSGSVGMIVDGIVRDLEDLRQRRFPVMEWGAVPSHGRFTATSQYAACGSGPDDLLQGDLNGRVRIPGNTLVRFYGSTRICWRARRCYLCWPASASTRLSNT
jgi:regulator of RNase E activity RraA